MRSELDLLLRALFEGNLQKRVASALALGDSGNRKAVGGLVQALKDELPQIRIAACEALGRLGDSRAIAPLVSMLRDDDDGIRGEAFSALISIGESRASALPAGAFAGEDPTAPSAALTQIVWHADLEAVQLLHDALEDQDPEVRIGALYTLGHLGVAGAFESIERVANTDQDADVQTAAAFALGELAERGDARAAVALRHAWHQRGSNGELAVVTCRALGSLSQGQDLRLFEEAIQHKDDRVRQLAAMALGHLNPRDSSVTLLRAMKDKHSGVRRIAVHSLSLLGENDSIPALIEGVIGEQPEVRAAIGEALKRFDASAVSAGLTMALNSQSTPHRSAAVYLMGRTGFDCGLAEAMTDHDEGVRKVASIAMGQIRPANAYQYLTSALGDDSWMVCVAALEGLRRMGDRRCMPLVSALSTHENHVVRNAVRLTLDVLGESMDKD